MGAGIPAPEKATPMRDPREPWTYQELIREEEERSMTANTPLNTLNRASLWLGLPEEIVRDMPASVQQAAARESGEHDIPDWLTKAVAACEVGSPGEATRLWRLLYAIGHLCR